MAQTFLVCKMHNNRALSILSSEYQVHSMIMHRSFCCSIGAVGRGEHSGFPGSRILSESVQKVTLTIVAKILLPVTPRKSLRHDGNDSVKPDGREPFSLGGMGLRKVQNIAGSAGGVEPFHDSFLFHHIRCSHTFKSQSELISQIAIISIQNLPRLTMRGGCGQV